MTSLGMMNFRKAAVAGLATAGLATAGMAMAGLAMAGLAAVPAQARIFVGIGVPFYGPAYVPPPVYYPPPPAYYPPPPAYYPPPPVYYTPQPAYSAPATVYSPPPSEGGQMCYAGSYTCPMDRPVAPGGSCYCLGNGGQRVPGRTN